MIKGLLKAIPRLFALIIAAVAVLAVAATVWSLSAVGSVLNRYIDLPGIESGALPEEISAFSSIFSLDEEKTETEYEYTIGEYECRVAVFDSEGVPLKVFDLYTFMLPEHDRELLKNGIRVYSDTELMSLIEDFTG